MFIGTLELFKIGIGPSSSHTMGPMVAAGLFLQKLVEYFKNNPPSDRELKLQCILKGSLAYTGKGHHTDRAVVLGLHGYTPDSLTETDVDQLVDQLWQTSLIDINEDLSIPFEPAGDVIFDLGAPLPAHPNGMIFRLLDHNGNNLLSENYYSIGGGFVDTESEIAALEAPLKTMPHCHYPFAFDTADAMLRMAEESGLSIAGMKYENELQRLQQSELDEGLQFIWEAMRVCVERGLDAEGTLPGGLGVKRRARGLRRQLLQHPDEATINDWLCAYAMAVNEENAAGHMVVTAPTNGAAGVIPAVLYYFVEHYQCSKQQIHEFLLTAAAIGGLIKHNSSISGAEVGCQGEVGSAAAMAAAGLCAARGGAPKQIENAAEIALEHHLGMTCDPVNGLVQVPCIERNGFGAIKAFTAASLALRGSGEHFMPLDSCIAAMRRTGQDMSSKYKETSLGGLAVSVTEC